MNTPYRYQLETPKVTGHRQQKFTCPQCGKLKCFVRYVDTQNGCNYVADHVGKCDHQHSCGYHYKPAYYFHDYPWTKRHYDFVRSSLPSLPIHQPKPELQPLPMSLVELSHSPRSVFWQWLYHTCLEKLKIDPAIVNSLYENYHIGATEHHEVIFWQIDEQQRVHTGHIMRYGPDGRRIGNPSWEHARLIYKKQLPASFQLIQCLFGQHLLGQRPEAHVCLVESEKTALIMAAHQPEHLWLATCGSGGLSPEKLKCLHGRRVTLFPDSGCYEKWSHQMQLTTGIDYNISPRLENYPPNTDLADLLLYPP